MRRTRAAVVAALTCLSLAFAAIAGGLAARAQVPTLPESTTTTSSGRGATSTTGPPPSPSTSTPLPGTTTTVPAGSSSTPPPGAPAGASPPTGPGGAVPPPQAIPPEYQAMINSVHRTGPSNDKALLDALQPLEAMGLPPVEVEVVGMGRFPVAGYAWYRDDWLEPRVGPPFHLHQGNDVFADCGLPVRSPLNGVLRLASDGLGGSTVYVTQADATYVYMAHLSAYVAGQLTGQTVRTGQVVGFVGNSGDAQGGACHVHFELHPLGAAAVDPKPSLDQWMADALAGAPRLVALYGGAQRSRPQAPIATGMTPRFVDPAAGPAPPAGPPRAELLWASAASPAGGPLQLAQAEVAEVARTPGWARAVALAEEEARLWREVDAAVVRLLTPTTPPGLRYLVVSP
jgi:murein DD-endopeptidase MepM/ murein hydrolase activator NlpD